MAFIRRLRTPSGATGVQFAEYVGDRRQLVVTYVGSAHTRAEVGVDSRPSCVHSAVTRTSWLQNMGGLHVKKSTSAIIGGKRNPTTFIWTNYRQSDAWLASKGQQNVTAGTSYIETWW